jgi:hypothetical protein
VDPKISLREKENEGQANCKKNENGKYKNKLFEQSEMKHNNQKGFFLVKPSA